MSWSQEYARQGAVRAGQCQRTFGQSLLELLARARESERRAYLETYRSAAGTFDAAFQCGALAAVAFAVLAMMAVVIAHRMAAGGAVRNLDLFHSCSSLDGAMHSPYEPVKNGRTQERRDAVMLQQKRIAQECVSYEEARRARDSAHECRACAVLMPQTRLASRAQVLVAVQPRVVDGDCRTG